MSNRPGRGDAVFFETAAGSAVSGECLSVGNDGCLVKAEGINHNVVWGRIIAYRTPGSGQEMRKALPPPAAPPAMALGDRARIDAALIGAGLVPSLEYVQATYGEHWSVPADTGALNKSIIDRLDTLIKAWQA